MSIPINGNLITGAVPLSQSVLASNPLALNKIPQLGLRYLSFQYIFTTTTPPPISVDLGGGNPPPLDQLSSIYVDASSCNADVTFLIADSGYSFTIKSGARQMTPIITSVKYPKIIFVCDTAPIINTFINVFLLNQYIPPMEIDSFLKNVGYGNARPLSPDNFAVPATLQTTLVSIPGGSAVNVGTADLISGGAGIKEIARSNSVNTTNVTHTNLTALVDGTTRRYINIYGMHLWCYHTSGAINVYHYIDFYASWYSVNGGSPGTQQRFLRVPFFSSGVVGLPLIFNIEINKSIGMLPYMFNDPATIGVTEIPDDNTPLLVWCGVDVAGTLTNCLLHGSIDFGVIQTP